MKDKVIFDYTSYKAIMAARLTGPQNRGQLTRAAEALNCQRSYLSRVIAEELHVTPDHAFNLSKFWRLKDDERDYFLTLVEHDRAGDGGFRTHLKSKLTFLKEKNESIQERTQRASLSIDSLQASYFSSWLWSAIHFLTSVPEYQNLKLLAERVGLREESALNFLKNLEARGFVENVKSRWMYKTGEFHAPKDSPLVILHHQNWRQRALVDTQNLHNQGIHFTGVLTLSKQDFEQMKELLLTFIAEANRLASPSKPEEAIALTCDLFRV